MRIRGFVAILCLASLQDASAQIRPTIYRYLNMADAKTQKEFRPMAQHERNDFFRKSLVGPLPIIDAAANGGIDQLQHSPEGWELGASGYGKRVGGIVAQRTISRTLTFGLESALHEDNRYFLSGYKGIWKRTRYALASSIMARRDDGSRTISISQIGGQAGAAFVSRTWRPRGDNSPSDAASAFGYGLLFNAGFSVVKEFLPDVTRKLGIAPVHH